MSASNYIPTKVQTVDTMDQLNTYLSKAATDKISLVLLYFHSSKSVPSKRFEPHFDYWSVASEFPNVLFLKCDIKTGKSIFEHYNITVKPTIKIFKNGKDCEEDITENPQGVSLDNLRNYITQKENPNKQHITNMFRLYFRYNISTMNNWCDRVAGFQQDPYNVRSRTCTAYNNKSIGDEECGCKRLIRKHSFTEDVATTVTPEPWKSEKHTRVVNLNTFGMLAKDPLSSSSVKIKYIRCDYETEMSVLYDLMKDDCDKTSPSCIISVFGGAKYFVLNEQLDKNFIDGIIAAATLSDAWILTAGLNSGVARLVGDAVLKHKMLRENAKPLTVIGFTKWGTITQETRTAMKNKDHSDEEFIKLRNMNQPETIDFHHTHLLLLDDGQNTGYLSDDPRSEFVEIAMQRNTNCYSVTIIVEGGINTLEVILDDIKFQRPVVIVQGSGRMADVLADLVVEAETKDFTIEEIKPRIEKIFPLQSNFSKEEVGVRAYQIIQILYTNKNLLNVFYSTHEKDIGKTIFNAIFKADQTKPETDSSRKLVREKELLKLAVKLNYLDGAKKLLEKTDPRDETSHSHMKDNQFITELFTSSLQLDRPDFVNYFLKAGYNLQFHQGPSFTLNLYNQILTKTDEENQSSTCLLPDNIYSINATNLDMIYSDYIGSFMPSIYRKTEIQSVPQLLLISLGRLKQRFVEKFCPCIPDRENNRNGQEPDPAASNTVVGVQVSEGQALVLPMISTSAAVPIYTAEETLRDLYLWSIFMNRPGMAKALLLHLKSRILAALIATTLFKRFSKESALDINARDQLRTQAKDFESIATACIDICYRSKNQIACELLIRPVKIFGNVTCMQVAIASECASFLQTACFDRTLNKIWYDKLSLSNQNYSSKPSIIISLLTLGLTAPWLLEYRTDLRASMATITPARVAGEGTQPQDKLTENGINYYTVYDRKAAHSCKFFPKKIWYFHRSLMTKMCYHFIAYTVFLLIFSYMMLYELDPDRTHGTEMYVIITVSLMTFEEIRQKWFQYTGNMHERRHHTNSLILTCLRIVFYILPYIMFYIGIILRYAGRNSSEVFTIARIFLAFDLELWFLRSLKFIIVFENLGPKLLMIQNMLKDLFAFIYIIFVSLVAYGVVSRSLFKHNELDFNGRAIFSEVVYVPYWFIYGSVDDKNNLDQIINGTNSTSAAVAEATATHVLLAFHMLFVNTLLLSLIVAVFTDTISKVQHNTKYLWRLQRYQFIREYFDSPPFSMPPLIIVIYVLLFVEWVCYRFERSQTILIRKFKLMPVRTYEKAMNEEWDEFESVATDAYASKMLHKKSISEINNGSAKTDLFF